MYSSKKLPSQFSNLLAELDPENLTTLPRLISLIENQEENISILASIPSRNIPVIGITGPPGAGKSTLLSGIILHLRNLGKRIAVLAIDPSSSFSKGSVLGDRIRMQGHYLDPRVYIRSIANRGFLGGLSAATSDILTIVQAYHFDYIFIETVGVGQSEIEVAGLSHCVVVVLVPESGDEIQSIKAGLIEIADILVVNKSDREGAETLMGILGQMLLEKNESQNTSLLKTCAEKNEGIDVLWKEIKLQLEKMPKKKIISRTVERIYQIIARKKMENFDRVFISSLLEKEVEIPGFNLYKFIEKIR